MRIVAFLAAVVGASALSATAPAATTVGRLTANDGRGFTITMSAKTVKAGTYRIAVHDRSSIHNFHLIGPGVNKKTSVAAVTTVTWTSPSSEAHITSCAIPMRRSSRVSCESPERRCGIGRGLAVVDPASSSCRPQASALAEAMTASRRSRLAAGHSFFVS